MVFFDFSGVSGPYLMTPWWSGWLGTSDSLRLDSPLPTISITSWCDHGCTGHTGFYSLRHWI